MTPPGLGVVVPARDEAALLPVCLDGLAAATRAVAGRARVRLLVVLDGCSDASADVVRSAGVEALATAAGGVGAARAAGCATLLRGPDAVGWLACTDADSRVPEGWLAAQLDALAAGWDARVGTVRVEAWDDRAPRARARHDRDYARGAGRTGADGHPHVHGANLGVSAAAYRRAGGFVARPTGEDVALVEALERVGAALCRTRALPVTTSARRRSRARAGFADRLTALERAVHGADVGGGADNAPAPAVEWARRGR